MDIATGDVHDGCMPFIRGPVSVTINGVDISDHVISVRSEDVEPMLDGVGWAYPVSWSDEDDSDALTR